MKATTFFFKPIARKGLIIHGLFLIFLLAIITILIIPLFNEPLGFIFILYLLSALLFAIPIPIIGYRFFALLNSAYIIESDGVRLKWGMRLEDLPMNKILWVQSVHDFQTPIRYPFFSVPGAYLGTVKQKNLPPIEFIASDKKNLILIGLENKIFAVSPLKINSFSSVFKEQMEYGSLEEIIPQSIQPSLVFTRIFKLPYMIILIIAGFILNLILLFTSGVFSTQYETINLGFNVLGMITDPISSTQLMLLPTISLLFYFANIFLSALVYRDETRAHLVYLLQIMNSVSCLLFLLALSFILSIS